MKRITDSQIVKHADGSSHEQLYCFGHLWGPAFFKQNSDDYEEYMTIVQRLKAYEDTGLTPEEIMDGKMLTGWIPVEKRVPEENGLYVVAIMAMGIAGPIYTRDLTDYEKESGWYARNVVAWLPCKLPEPYRPETLRREAGTEAGQDTAAQVLQSAT